MRIESSVSECSSAMAGDASNAAVLTIFRSIMFSRGANWEGMWKKILSPFVVCAIDKSICESKVPPGSN